MELVAVRPPQQEKSMVPVRIMNFLIFLETTKNKKKQPGMPDLVANNKKQ